MALRTPPSWLQNGSHPAENDRLTMQGIVSSTGIIGTSSLQVTAQASPNMTVNVATGWAGIVSSTSNAGVYLAYNDATTVLTITTADTVNPRKDIIVATVSDSYYSGSTNTVAFQVIAGTPASSPTPPSTPTNSILLATITVAANTTTITSGNIVDGRTVASSNLVNGVSLPFTGGTLTGGLVLSGGSSSVAPLKISNATVLSSPVGGAVEYDGSTAYFTPSASAVGGHGVLPSVFYYALSSNRSIATSTYSLFGAGITLAGSTTYELEMVVNLTGLSSSTHTVVIGTSGSATFTSAYALGTGSATTVGDPTSGITVQPSTTNTATYFLLKGLLRVNASGTYNPQITTSLGATPLVLANSYVKLTPLGSNSVTSVGAWA